MTVAVLINSRLLDSLLVVVQVVFVAFVVVVVIATVIVEHTVVANDAIVFLFGLFGLLVFQVLGRQSMRAEELWRFVIHRVWN